MRPHTLNFKNVISKDGRHIGTVSGIEIEISTWKVTHLSVSLLDKTLQPSGLTLERSTGMKQVETLLPVETVEFIGDLVVLNKTVEELKEIIKKPS
jgi:sporulation protein YlmC with PRC-barrel domain